MAPSLLAAFLLLPALIAIRVVYRRFFHPLASVPGPALAAITSGYEFYYDVIKDGKYHFKVQELHEKYGPIVRITPREVHISDPAYLDILYNTTNKVAKDTRFYNIDGTNGTGFSTGPHEVHRRRRGAISKFLSAANVAKQEAPIQAKLKKLLDRFDQMGRAGRPLDLFNAWRSLTMDVVSIFSEPTPRNNIDSPDFARSLHIAIRGLATSMMLQRWFPIMSILDVVPVSFFRLLNPVAASLAQKREDLCVEARALVSKVKSGSCGPAQSIFEALASSDMLSPEDKTPRRMANEAEVLISAGTETTSNTLAVLVYRVLENPQILQRLQAELRACSDAPRDALVDFRTLDKLPYLQAVIQESLRVACPVCGRLPRINPHQAMTYTSPGPDPKTYTLPPGTVMSMSMPYMHYNADIFPQPKAFAPERWLPASDPACTATPAHRRVMDRHFIPFGKGSRNCIGLELAKHTMVATVGNLFRRFDMELFETTERDVAISHDYFSPFCPADSEGVRIKIKYE